MISARKISPFLVNDEISEQLFSSDVLFFAFYGEKRRKQADFWFFFFTFAAVMILKKLTVVNYKNIAQADLELSAKMNCLIGRNGMGKTNLLDAVYYLSFCRSATNPIDSQVIRHEADYCLIQGHYETEQGDGKDVFCGLKRGQRKQVKLGGKVYQRSSEHVGVIPLVMISPSDAELISGGSDERRRFMDVAISQYDKEYLLQLILFDS